MRFRLLLLALLLAPSSAFAAPRIVVGALKGDKRGAVGTPLRQGVCKAVSCIPPSMVGLPRKIDWKKVGRQRVLGVLTGTVIRNQVRLQLFTNPGAPAQTWAFPLQRGKLSPDAIAGVRDDIVNRFAPPPAPVEPAPAPAPAQPPPPAAAPAPSSRPAPAPSASTPAPASSKAAPREAAKEEKKPKHEREEGEPTFPVFRIEVGADLERRTLHYDALTTANLSEYEAPLVTSPRLRLELYPLGHLLENAGRGIGLDVDYRVAIGLKSAVEGGPSHPTRHSVFAADLRFRYETEGGGFAVTPFVGYRRAGFRVDPASDGSTFAGLPKIVTSGPRFGLGLEVMPTQGFRIFGQADYVAISSAPDLISDAFFPKGSAKAIEAELGLGYTFEATFDVRLVGELTSTSFSFTPGATTVYVANGASETLLGGRLMFGYQM